jgi:beta-glucosidase
LQNELVSQKRIDDSVRRILTLKFALGLFDHPYVDPDAADAGGRSAAADVHARGCARVDHAAPQPGQALPLSPSTKVVGHRASADSMTNQLGGWSVSWQGVFGAGHVCCMGPPDQIPPGTRCSRGLQARDPNVTYAPDQASASRRSRFGRRIVAVVGEKAYAEGLGDNPAPARSTRSEVADLRARGDRQAGHRRRHRGRPLGSVRA